MKKDVMVSVQVLAYNHEKTIARALDSILSQKTQYSFEIVVGEDASTDGTAAIVKEYAEKYPDIIVFLRREKNLGIIENGIDTLRHCRGKYIAQCEGDDYWCVEDKLEKQICFLETNPDYYSCVTKCLYVHNGIEEKYPFASTDAISVKDMLNHGDVKRYPTCTGCYRNPYLQEPELLDYFSRSKMGDLIGATVLICKGKIRYMDYITGVYERFDRGNSESFSSQSIEKQVVEIKKAISACKEISEHKWDCEWEKYEAIFNRGIYNTKCERLGNKEARKWVKNSLSIKERCYLCRLLLKDYVEYKKNSR